MRKWMTFLMTFLVGASSYVNADNGTVAVELGYRNDRISLKNFARGEEVRHEFKDLDIFQIGACARGNLGCNLYGRASGGFGWILDGKYSNRTDTNNSYSGVTGGKTYHDVADDKYVFDANVAVGYPFYFCDCTMEMAPTVGYSFNEQNLRLERGFDDSSDDSYYGSSSSVNAGSFEQKFINRWYGPFIGFDFQYRPYNECWNLFAQFEFHFSQYKGRRNDGNVGTSNHTSLRANRGHGYVFNIGAEYDFCNCWTASLAVKFTDFAAHKNHGHCCGNDTSDDYYASYPNGNSEEAHSHYKWYSTAITFAVGRAF